MLLDDIATTLNKVGLMTKVAIRQTSGVVADDLALNAQQLAGFSSSREWPIVWAVGVGSLVNKAILIPIAIGLSVFWPFGVRVLLLIGGAYLCVEGAVKVIDWVGKLLQRGGKRSKNDELGAGLMVRAKVMQLPTDGAEGARNVANEGADAHDVGDKTGPELVVFDKQEALREEKKRVRGAIRTDFVLSAEIIVISLGMLAGQGMGVWEQAGVLVLVSLTMTFGVYGLVALIVKIDDAGLWLAKKEAKGLRLFGAGLIWLAPNWLKLLTVVGTVAMFGVGGHIWVEGVSWIEHLAHEAQNVVSLQVLKGLSDTVISVFVGFVLGLVLWPGERLLHHLVKMRKLAKRTEHAT